MLKREGNGSNGNKSTEMEVMKAKMSEMENKNHELLSKVDQITAKADLRANQIMLRTLQALRNGNVSDEDFDAIQLMLSTPNFQILWLLATKDRLPTKVRMIRWGGVDEDSCVLCNSGVDSAAHLWFECSVVQQILERVLVWQGIITRKTTLQGWWHWFIASNKRSNNIYLARLLSITGVVYFCWKLRNDVIFNQKIVSIDGVGNEIINACKFRLIHKLKTNTRRGRAMIRRLLR